MSAGRPFEDLRDSGLLWLINRVVMHPRGYALALHFDGTAGDPGPATGWSILGDGSEPWGYAPSDQWPDDQPTEADLFAAVSRLLAQAVTA